MKKLGLCVGIAAYIISLQSCLIFTDAFMYGPDGHTSKSPADQAAVTSTYAFSVGSNVNGKTVVWINRNGGRWTYLAMGLASEPMQWANDDSRVLSERGFSTDMGKGRDNTVYIDSEFSSHAHLVTNNAAKYCLSKGGWLPSRDEAEKVAEFMNKKFWTSNGEKLSKAYYYSPVEQAVRTAFRSDRNNIVTVPIYYLDENGNPVNP